MEESKGNCRRKRIWRVGEKQFGFLVVSGSGFLSGKGIGNYIIMSAVEAQKGKYHARVITKSRQYSVAVCSLSYVFCKEFSIG